MGIFGLLGWMYGAIKIPTIAGIAVTKKVGGCLLYTSPSPRD